MSKRNFYPTFEEAKRAAQAFNFSSAIDYRCRRLQCDSRLHSNPQSYYRKHWCGWHNFLNTAPATLKLYQEYKTAQTIAAKANFKNARAYKLFCKSIDERLPKVPEQFYASHWQGWGDFLGINEKEYYQTYQEAQNAAKALGITSSLEYFAKRKEKDDKLPPNPIKFYASVWSSWYAFLGTKREDSKLYSNYDDAKSAARKFNFCSATDYQKRAKQCDERLPCKPREKYKHNWHGWSDYLGLTDYDTEPFPPFTKLKEMVRAQRFSSINDYVTKRHYIANNLPILPNEVYQEWQGWQDFLGASYQSNQQFMNLTLFTSNAN